MRNALDSAIFAVASLIADNVPSRNRHKGRPAEVHLDVTEALLTLVDQSTQALRQQIAQQRADLKHLTGHCDHLNARITELERAR